MDPNRRIMLKTRKGPSLNRKIRSLHKDFDGKTQAIRGFLIAELEELAKIAAENAQKASGKGKARAAWFRV